MSKKKILKPSLKTAKQLSKKGLYVPKGPKPLTFEMAKLPDWVALVLFEIANGSVPVLCTNKLPPHLLNFPGVVVDTQDVIESGSQENNYYIHAQTGYEQELLSQYLQAYEDNCLLVQNYKTFEKSMKATIKILIAAEKNKGNKFGLDGISKPSEDVRFYSDLVYLWDMGLLKLTLPEEKWKLQKDLTIAGIEVEINTSAQAMSSYVFSPPPDALYNGLKLFLNEKRLEYHKKKCFRMQTERPMCKILEYMMQNPTPLSLKKACAKFGIATTKNDPEARGKIDNFLYRANLRLRRVKFQQRLCITAKEICWKQSND